MDVNGRRIRTDKFQSELDQPRRYIFIGLESKRAQVFKPFQAVASSESFGISYVSSCPNSNRARMGGMENSRFNQGETDRTSVQLWSYSEFFGCPHRK